MTWSRTLCRRASTPRSFRPKGSATRTRSRQTPPSRAGRRTAASKSWSRAPAPDNKAYGADARGRARYSADGPSGNSGGMAPNSDRGACSMSDLVVIAFPSEAKAEEVRQKLLDMQKDYLIELGDAVVAVKQPSGSVKLNQLFHPTATGAVSGTFWGTLIGLIFLMPLAGAAIGAASGAIGGALTDVGLDDKWMKETAAAIQPGTAALFVLVRKVTADKVLEGLKGEGGTVLKTSLDHTKEEALKAALAGAQAAVPAATATT